MFWSSLKETKDLSKPAILEKEKEIIYFELNLYHYVSSFAVEKFYLATEGDSDS